MTRSRDFNSFEYEPKEKECFPIILTPARAIIVLVIFAAIVTFVGLMAGLVGHE
jgi:hypothetical protein